MLATKQAREIFNLFMIPFTGNTLLLFEIFSISEINLQGCDGVVKAIYTKTVVSHGVISLFSHAVGEGFRFGQPAPCAPGALRRI